MQARIAMTSNLRDLIKLIEQHQPVLVLTGAGISTGSGIRAYRDNEGTWVGPKPVQDMDYRKSHRIRQRYWLRSMFGWPTFSNAEPNSAHKALARLENLGVVSALITQNVDGLHQRAGSSQVIELHGSLAQVICLECGLKMPRADLQAGLENQNPQFLDTRFVIGPDGDATISKTSEHLSDFELISCRSCDGILKPDVVFFGANVPSSRVRDCMELLEQSAMLLCIGTSLSVFSGFRFCRSAHDTGKPIVLINQGSTRADELATLKLPEDCEETLESLASFFSQSK